jgi:membrane-associated protease RseP (regulator of RpoE activity)
MSGLLAWIAIWLALYALQRASQWAACAHCLRPLRQSLSSFRAGGGEFVWTPLYLHVSTSALCERIYAFGQRRRVALQRWFAPGAACSAVGALVALALLAHNLVRFALVQSTLLWARYAAQESNSDPAGAAASLAAAGQASAALRGELLQLSLPGVTLPWSKVGYMALALGAAMAFHELGHALAAAAHAVPPVRIGILLGLGIFPAAYVELQEEGEHSPGHERLHDEEAQRHAYASSAEEVVPLQPRHVRSVLVAPALSHPPRNDRSSTRMSFPALPPLHKLDVTSAGIWHNVVLCTLCLALLWALPLLLWAGYSSPQAGLVVLQTNAAASPALAGSALLRPGAVVTHLDEDALHDADTWRNLLLQSARLGATGGGASSSWGHCASRPAMLSLSKATEAAEARLLYESSLWRWVLARNNRTRSVGEQLLVDELCCVPGVLGARKQCFLVDPPPASTAAAVAAAAATVSGPAVAPTGGSAAAAAAGAGRGASPSLPAPTRAGPTAHACARAIDLLAQGARRCTMGQPNVCEPVVRVGAPTAAVTATATAAAASTASGTNSTEDRTCVQLALDDPSQRLFVLRVAEPRPDRSCTAATALEDGCSAVLLFVGRPAELFSALRFTTLRPRFATWLDALLPSFIFSALVHAPVVLAEALRWILAVSGSLALLNCAPMHMADGAHSLRYAADLLLQHLVSRSASPSRAPSAALVARVDTAVLWTLRVGSALFALNLAITLAYIAFPAA